MTRQHFACQASSDIDGSPMPAAFHHTSTMSLNLDEVLRSEFRAAYDQEANTKHSDLSDVFSNESGLVEHCSQVIDSQLFMLVFLILTVYALFATDLDTLFGTVDSRYVLSIVTTVVFLLFGVELLLLSLFKYDYAFRAFFWLDLVALVSLLPETWFVQQLFASDSLVAARSTRMMKAIRLVIRSSKATRLNRFTRMVRVSAMLPRLFQAATRKPEDSGKDVEALLDRKLHRIFVYLDKDQDGMVSAALVDVIVRRIMRKKKPRRSLTRMLTRNLPAVPAMRRENSGVSDVGGEIGSRRVTVRSASSDECEGVDSSPTRRVGNSPRSPASSRRVEKLQTFATLQSADSVICSQSLAEDAARLDLEASLEAAVMSQPTEWQRAVSEPTASATGLETSMSMSVAARGGFRRKRAMSKKTTLSSSASMNRNASTASVDSDEEEDLVSYADFKDKVLEDDIVRAKLYDACQDYLGKGANMKNIGRHHVEDVGVKVALMVIMLLFILSFIVPEQNDNSSRLVLAQLDYEAQARYGTWNDTIAPKELLEHFMIWKHDLTFTPQEAQMVYLDLNYRSLCADLEGHRISTCAELNSESDAKWPVRDTLKSIDQAFLRSPVHRVDDLMWYRNWLPGIDQSTISPQEDISPFVSAVVIFNMRSLNEREAVNSLMISWTVILIILVGMFTITTDLGKLSSRLLEPLRTLADEMQSIAQLQLAAVTTDKGMRGAAEVRLIWHIFSKTKVAIRSWGKYVPWPVVQNLLVAGEEVRPKIEEREVTLFFSDMASFTSIVEKLEPEQTLLLLSRYFNDMSDVIDKFGGIVIEFIGDAIYAVFGAPVRNREHAEAGVNAMLKMLKTVQRINQWAKHRLLPEVSIRCGVHSGPVQVGNMGFHSRLKYGVMGSGAEIPSKLEEMNKTYGTHNLISESTFHKLPPDGYVMRPIDFVDMSHGSADPEPVYEVMSQIANSSSPSTRSSRRDTLARKYETALDMYTEKRFAKAAAQFREVSTSMGQTFGIYDKPSVLMRKRAAYYMQHPPPEGWKGVWTRTREPDETDGVEDEVVYVCV
mmetsp:Transcript_40202/g.94141  ORF Transcript_40202/g.94141 Transcript_40202/m.94141 type:complete len:1056 (+) Transcript_40202:102-3269(+)